MAKTRPSSVLLLAPKVHFKHIPWEMVDMFRAVLLAAESQGVRAIITGAAGKAYPKGKVHAEGYGIDVRTSGIPDPGGFAGDIRRTLRAVSPHYVVLYGDEQHLDHIHIGFAWFHARRIP